MDTQKIALAAVGGVAVAAAVGAFSYYHFFHEPRDKRLKDRILRAAGKTSRTMEIPQRHVQDVFGPNRKNLKKIEKETNTKIDSYTKDDGPRKVTLVTITGAKKDVDEAELKLFILTDQWSGFVEDTFEIPAVTIGRVIGSDGYNIKRLNMVYNVNIKVERPEPEIDQEEGPATVTVYGEPHNVQFVKVEILNCSRDALIADEERRLRGDLPLLDLHRNEDGASQPLSIRDSDQQEMRVSTERGQWACLEAGGADGSVEVYVTAVGEVSSGCFRFWVSLVGPRANDLDRLNETINAFYSVDNILAEMLVIERPQDIHLGKSVVAKNSGDNKWYRAMVTEIEIDEYDEAASRVEVFYLDFGGTERVGISSVYQVRPEFLELQFQAIECALAGVKAVETSDLESLKEEFSKLTYSGLWKPVTVVPVGRREMAPNPPLYYEPRQIPSVRVFNRGPSGLNEPEDVLDTLAKKGFLTLETESK